MNIGYACKLEGIQNLNFKSCTLRSATSERLRAIITHNLHVLDKVLDYNIRNEIFLFRISSDIIPLASHASFTYEWQKEFKQTLQAIGDKAIKHGIRLSMHPGQYTVLNSPNDDVVTKAIADLQYHCNFLDALGLPSNHKIILHIGGVYNDKPLAMERFIENYKKLSTSIKRRLVIENDDRSYTVNDVYEISMKTAIPIVYDNLHHYLNHGEDSDGDREWILKCKETWKHEDGVQKVHYSQQDSGKKNGAHSKTIDTSIFLAYIKELDGINIDVMLEVKDKNLSAIKCILCTGKSHKLTKLEAEWAKYKYTVLEYNHNHYIRIRELLKEKTNYPVITFFNLIDEAILKGSDQGFINAYEHIWGYFKKQASKNESMTFKKLEKEFKNKAVDSLILKHFLYRLALKYQEAYILDSYFFVY